MSKRILSLLLAGLVLTACSGNTTEDNPPTPAASAAAVPPAFTPASAEARAAVPGLHNAQNSLDWSGTYKGLLPCASCEGIATELVLNDDGTYSLTEDYQGGKEVLKETVTGKFTWLPGGSVVQLDAAADQRQYFVGEGQIKNLDAHGKEATGELASYYVLKKAP